MSSNVTLYDLNVVDPRSRLPFKPCMKVNNAVGAKKVATSLTTGLLELLADGRSSPKLLRPTLADSKVAGECGVRSTDQNGPRFTHLATCGSCTSRS